MVRSQSAVLALEERFRSCKAKEELCETLAMRESISSSAMSCNGSEHCSAEGLDQKAGKLQRGIQGLSNSVRQRDQLSTNIKQHRHNLDISKYDRPQALTVSESNQRVLQKQTDQIQHLNMQMQRAQDDMWNIGAARMISSVSPTYLFACLFVGAHVNTVFRP